MCFFRCLALHYGAKDGSLEELAVSYKTQLEEATGKSYDEGVKLDMLEEVENEFNIAIHVYSLQENKTAEVIRLPKNHDVTDKMHLNLYECALMH